MSSKNIDLIRQALGAAESSIKLAKQLLNELESGKMGNSSVQNSGGSMLPGLTGSFDGENMVTASGETFTVPANYASKSMLVVGDTLKMVEEGKEKRFKQIEHVKRYRTAGIITKKDGKWKAITPEGSYKVLPAAIEHLGADVGSEVNLHLPANNLTVAYAAIESVKGATKPVPKAEDEESKTEKAKEAVNEKVAVEKVVVEKAEPKDAKPESKTEVKIEPKPQPKPEPKIAAPVKIEKETIKKEEKPQNAASKKVEEKIETPPEPKAAAPAAPTVQKMEISPEEDELT